VGFRKLDQHGETEYLVLPESFRAEVCLGLDCRMVARALAEGGHLLREDEKHLTVRRKLPAIGLKRVYAIQPSILAADDTQTVVGGGHSGHGGHDDD
jgi:hypothetical protein